MIVHPTVTRIAELLQKLGLRLFVIGARAVLMCGVDIGRETRDWDFTIDKPFTRELRDQITSALRMAGFKVQWRKWGFLVEDDAHIDINYAPLILDEDFLLRSKEVVSGIYLPCLEDLVILKLMAGERKDIQDVKRILRQMWHVIDRNYLFMRARQSGLEHSLSKLLRRLDLNE